MSRFGSITGGTANARSFVAQGADPETLFAAFYAGIAGLAAIVPPLADPVTTSFTLTGAGDGHMFFVEIAFAAGANADGGAVITDVKFLLAATAEDLQGQIVALQSASPIIDVQIAGSAKGQRVMAMVLFGTLRSNGCPPTLLQYELLETPFIASLSVGSVVLYTDSIPATATAVDAWFANPIAAQPRMALVGVQYTLGSPSALQFQIQNLDPVLALQLPSPVTIIVAYYTCPITAGNIIPPP